MSGGGGTSASTLVGVNMDDTGFPVETGGTVLREGLTSCSKVEIGP